MEISLIPRSPCSLGEQIFLQITQDIFFLPSSQPHKKLLCNLNILTIPSGTLKKDKKNKGKKASTKLFKLILLAKEKTHLGLRTKITFDCDSTEEMQTSSVTSYLSTNLLVSLLNWLITFEQRGKPSPYSTHSRT